MAAIYRDLVADDARTTQVISDVTAALQRGRHCLGFPDPRKSVSRR